MSNRSKRVCALAVVSTLGLSAAVHAGLGFTVSTGDWPDDARRTAAVNAMQAVVDLYNSYGDFGNYNIYVYYNAGIPTAQSNYLGSIGFGGTYPNQRVAQHESNHYLGSGTTGNWNDRFVNGVWTGPNMTALVSQFDGEGSVIRQSGVHFYGYGLNYDTEVVNASILPRNVALMYAQRQDDGLGNPADPWTATSVALTRSDPAGTSAFNWQGAWTDNHFAHRNAAYSTNNFTLRTPLDTYNPGGVTPSFTFAGTSLSVNNSNSALGGLIYKGIGNSGVLTINDLRLDGGYVRHASGSGDLFQLAGKVTLTGAPAIDAAQGSIKIASNIGGSGSLTKAGNYSLTLTGAGTYAGNTLLSGGTLRLAPTAPVASYTFDNVSGTTVINEGSGGGGMNGTLANGAMIVAGGQTGNAVSLGFGASVDINSPITDMGSNANWTVSAWVKTFTPGGSILTKGDGGWAAGNTVFYLGDGTAGGTGSIPSAVRNGGGFYQGSTAAKSVTDNAWHQITYVDSGGTYALYVDGVAQPLAAGNAGFTSADIGSIVRLGVSTNTIAGDGTLNYNGLLDNVQFYNRGLSAGQVATIYGGNRLFGSLPTTTNLTVAGGATLDINGSVQQIGSLTGVVGSRVMLGNGRLIVDSSANTEFAGAMSGTGGSLVKQGTGTLTLSGSNTYTGSTTINAGTLRLATIAGASIKSAAVANYTFDAVSGATVTNGGLGGSAMNGAITGGGTVVAGGHTGNAIRLTNGASVLINNPITDLGSAGEWTISAWVNTTSPGGTILDKSDGGWAGGNTIFYLGDGTGGGSGSIPSAVRYAGGFFQGATNAQSVTDGVWHQVTYVNSGGAYAIYIDGVAQPLSAGNAGFSNADVGGSVRLGMSTNTVAGDGTLNFNGLLDDVQIYGSALAADQISALFRGASVGPLPTTTDLAIASGATLDVNGIVQQVATLNGPVGATVALGNGQLIIGGATSSVFAGVVSGTGGSILKQGTGTLTLAGTNTYTGGTMVTSGTLVAGSGRALGDGPAVITGGTLALQPGLSTPLAISALSISPGGKVDLSSSGLVIDYASTDTTSAAIAVSDIVAGRITSSLLAGDASLAIGSATATDLGGTFQTLSLDGSALVLLATFKGDTNLDKTVNFTDLLALAQHYGTSGGATWTQGDSNYDSAVDFTDLLALAQNYNQALPASVAGASDLFASDWALAQSLTPEPASLAAVAGMAALGLRRRRIQSF